MAIISKVVRKWFTEAPHFTGTIIESERVGSRIQRVRIGLPESVMTPFPLGSYVTALTWDCVPRCYSTAKSDEHSFTLLVSFSGGGCGARFFRDSPVGTKVLFYGPFDDFPYRSGTGRPKVFFATSTGIAPFRMMLDEAIKEGAHSTIYLGSPKEPDIALRSEFEELQKNHPSLVAFNPVLSNGDPSWAGARGYLTDYIPKNAKSIKESDIYICGIPPMTFGVLSALEAIEVPEKQIFVQKFG
ncbi:MAG: CDP-6-deoxy-delta-3,4-glucoseen reductase [Parcubacteria group bacterium GW2011_GWA1_44_13]|uniref:CDP-6-deoxy-delta-3,4-glucoseen reductase n=1 Tax=Candidatus Nomurabacteria bacterium GW2011_GWB1_44_12 TaxID=1618748 RepID=A0A837ICN6_9BACT|nr:MAG: CDP-6-deoxy-delta-3,4-glucoseen reductase [Candidatus Nomurabacteria bacterium GW2011_GWD1_44_10]KKT36591.1 MAG: CDP-6-deoxy-delta-3,4-glucoseen reductase [Candidatus Nomurabacteria bacterium GW2011_GWB1_44_12]KKT38217.1 MAG: CDP-6-deoxy-delta-3,4-glucoseen reductase [Parcubacteria group bacterium GW2011_GWA1_44_13]KKT60698.1 MAG: CDP-6-deoxy-delta-3,4-glucoseen reductase [Parcubacteria group bacterium GW2011_GWC1_44_26]HBB44226.1 hypothetical protein [Candidatus Yonathbacteria bacteriu